MCRSDRKSHRRVHLALTGLALATLAACATDPSKPPRGQSEICKAGETLVCAYRMGKQVKCWCDSNERLRDILQEAKATAVFVTHDQEEALAMSDMVAVMRNGRVVQAATPRELYTSPTDAWVAGFLGDADFLPGHAHQGRVETPVGTFATPHDGKVSVMLRPEDISVIPDPDGDAVVIDREFFGHDQLITVTLPGGIVLRARSGPGTVVAPDQRVWLKVGNAVTFPD